MNRNDCLFYCPFTGNKKTRILNWNKKKLKPVLDDVKETQLLGMVIGGGALFVLLCALWGGRADVFSTFWCWIVCTFSQLLFAITDNIQDSFNGTPE